MAKYKNREVQIIQEIPHSQGDQVLIEHRELLGQREIVPRNQVVVSKEELKAHQKAREDAVKQSDANEYRVEGETEAVPVKSVSEVIHEKLAEAHAKAHAKAEEVKHKAEDKNWFKK